MQNLASIQPRTSPLKFVGSQITLLITYRASCSYSRTKRNVIAMFKPRDEEAFAPNNPRNYIGKPEHDGIRPESGAASRGKRLFADRLNLITGNIFSAVQRLNRPPMPVPCA